MIDAKVAIDWSPDQISREKSKHRLFMSYQRIYQHFRADKLAGGALYNYIQHNGSKEKREQVGILSSAFLNQ